MVVRMAMVVTVLTSFSGQRDAKQCQRRQNEADHDFSSDAG
jgi:hypothetical protein